jgi:DNA-directed RNA polymerase subunit RPC12/RpoP
MENEGSPITAEQYSCAQCGAKLDFAPGTAAMKCPYCGFELQIAESDTQVAELDYKAYLEKSAGEKPTLEAKRVKCNQCGAETTVSPNAAADICPFCAANLVFSESVSRLIKPEGLLPFKVSQKEAFEKFRKWIQGLWFAPGSLKQYARTETKLAGVYIPFWTYDSETTTDYGGERGDYYYTNENYTTTENGRTVTRTRRVWHTNWTPVGGTVRNSFDDILILAGKSLPRVYATRLEPWDLANMVPYADEYLSGFRAESYQVSLAEGFEDAKVVMASVIESTIRQDIGGDEQRIHSTQTQYGRITFKHILLPVWLTAYRFREKVFRILINARTGEVQGERPYSAWKITLAVLAALVILGIVILIGTTRQ